MDVLAPMPSVSETTAASVTIGVAARERSARRKSCIVRIRSLQSIDDE
jgi:hypothetical protein